MAYIQTS